MRRRFDPFRIRRGLRVLIVSVCLFPCADLAAAQETTAGFVGQVRDESGGVLPGVTVTTTSPALQVPSMTSVTNSQGEYRLTPLPIGTYTVEYTLTGFQTVRQENVRLDIGVQLRLDVILKVGALAETVTVSGLTPVVDVTATAASTHFTGDTLDLTPTSRNGLISLAAQAPGVRTRLDIGGGTVGSTVEFKSFGQIWDGTIIMEGMDTTSPEDGGMGANYYDYTSIDEARIQSISNGPEVPSHGVAITMITKSGGNDFHGSASYGFMNHRMESNNIDAALEAQGITSGNPLVKRTDYGVDLGGRILRDKLWFYGSGRYRQHAKLQLGGFKPDGSQAEGYISEVLVNDKLSYQMNPANRFVLWSQWARKHDRALAVSEFFAWESRGSRVLHPKTWKTEWQATRGNSLIVSLLLGRWGWTAMGDIATLNRNKALKEAGIPNGFEIDFTNHADFADGRPSTRDIVTLKQAGTPTGGGGLTDFGKYDGKGTLSWYRPDLFLGHHEFKTAVDYSRFWIIRGNGSRGEAGDYELIFSNGSPFQINTYNFPSIPLTNLSYTSAYGNDTWTIGRRLTLDLGVRYQHDNLWVPAQCTQAGAWPFTPAACTEVIPFKAYNAITPRLYFSYDVAGDAKTVLKGGWGRFAHQRLIEEVALNPFLASTSTFSWRDLNGNRDYDPGEVNLDQNGPDFVSTATAAGRTPRFIVSNPNEKQMGSDQLSLTLERQLAQDLAVRVSGLYIRGFNATRYLNTLRPPEAYNIPITNPDPGPDGVLRTADDPGTFITYYDFPAALAGVKNERFIISNDFGLIETHRALDLQLLKRISNGWQFLASYSATKNAIPLVRGPDGTRYIPFWDPNVDINNSSNTWEWVGKLSGTYVLPAQVSLSANFSHESGAPQARQVLFRGGRQIPTIVLNAEPIGSIHLPHTNVLDIRADKAFALPRSGHRVALRVNVYNALNANTVLTRTLRSGSAYLRPTSILPPRILEVGLYYNF